MKAVGLVVEYNPFHNGHRYRATTARAGGDHHRWPVAAAAGR